MFLISWSLWNYHRDEINDDANENDDNNDNNNNNNNSNNTNNNNNNNNIIRINKNITENK